MAQYSREKTKSSFPLTAAFSPPGKRRLRSQHQPEVVLHPHQCRVTLLQYSRDTPEVAAIRRGSDLPLAATPFQKLFALATGCTYGNRSTAQVQTAPTRRQIQLADGNKVMVQLRRSVREQPGSTHRQTELQKGARSRLVSGGSGGATQCSCRCLLPTSQTAARRVSARSHPTPPGSRCQPPAPPGRTCCGRPPP